MVADLKIGSLTFKYVFYRPEHNAKGGSHELNNEGLKMPNEIYQ